MVCAELPSLPPGRSTRDQCDLQSKFQGLKSGPPGRCQWLTGALVLVQRLHCGFHHSGQNLKLFERINSTCKRESDSPNLAFWNEIKFQPETILTELESLHQTVSRLKSEETTRRKKNIHFVVRLMTFKQFI